MISPTTWEVKSLIMVDYIFKIQEFLFPASNTESVVFALCKAAGIRIAKSDVSYALRNHPDYPSLLSICDILQDLGIPSKGLYLKCKQDCISITEPWIAQIESGETTLFAIVYLCTEDKVTWWNPISRKVESISYSDFIASFTGYILAVSIEKKHRVIEKQKSIQRKNLKPSNLLLLSFLLVLFLLICPMLYIGQGNRVISLLLCFFYMIGGSISMILMFIEEQQVHSAFNRICHIGANVSCSSVVSSPASRILGVSTATLGLTYFLGMLLWLTIYSYNCTITALTSWLHLLITPLPFIFIYYQYRVIRKWCPLCLIVQLTILLVLATYLFSTEFLSGFSFDVIQPYLFTGLICFTLSFCLGVTLNAWLKTKHRKYVLQKQMKQLLYDKEVFYTLLQKEHWTSPPPSSLGIFQGNINGNMHVVMVCNPYCSPCAKTHSIISSLLDNNDNIKLQIIFFTKNNSNTRSIVSCFLSLYGKGKIQASDFLDKWYSEENMTLEQFSKLYNIDNKNLTENEAMIEQMNEWCYIEGVKYTPTIYLDGYKLPTMYDAEDVKYFLRS